MAGGYTLNDRPHSHPEARQGGSSSGACPSGSLRMLLAASRALLRADGLPGRSGLPAGARVSVAGLSAAAGVAAVVLLWSTAGAAGRAAGAVRSATGADHGLLRERASRAVGDPERPNREGGDAPVHRRRGSKGP